MIYYKLAQVNGNQIVYEIWTNYCYNYIQISYMHYIKYISN